MPPRKTKVSHTSAKNRAPRVKAAPKRTKAAAPTRKKPVARKQPAAKSKVPKGIQRLDLSAFPPESITSQDAWICIACVSDVFTRHLDLSPRTAHLAIKGYTPSIAELYAPNLARPWFGTQPTPFCPYCGAPSKWHTRFLVHRIE